MQCTTGFMYDFVPPPSSSATTDFYGGRSTVLATRHLANAGQRSSNVTPGSISMRKNYPFENKNTPQDRSGGKGSRIVANLRGKLESEKRWKSQGDSNRSRKLPGILTWAFDRKNQPSHSTRPTGLQRPYPRNPVYGARAKHHAGDDFIIHR